MALKERVGTVVSDKMDKTVVVAVENRFPHPIYQKTVSRTTRYKAHDETNAVKVGDRVRITETRPLSRTKRWQVAEVLTTTSAGNIAAVLTDRADLAIVTRSFQLQHLKAQPEIRPQLLVAEQPDQVYRHTVVLRDGGPIAVAAVDALIDRLATEGKLARLWRAAGIED